MADETSKPAETAPTAPAANPAQTAVANAPQAAKRSAKRSPPRAVKTEAKPARMRTPRAANPATVARKPAPLKTVPRKAAAAKSAPPLKSAPAAKPVAKKAPKPVKTKKVKLVRDSFTMPETEYAMIALLKKRCLGVGFSAKKSEILRAAVAGLAKQSDASVVTAIRKLEVIKTGRPAKAAK
jgi:hypothetical protein